jgi:hypothetical protein
MKHFLALVLILTPLIDSSAKTKARKGSRKQKKEAYEYIYE